MSNPSKATWPCREGGIQTVLDIRRIDDIISPRSMQVAAVYLDLETTGLDAEYHAIVEIGAVAMDALGTEISAFQSLCNPGEDAMRNSDPRAFEISGIDPADVRQAEPVEIVSTKFSFWCADYGQLHAFPNIFEQGFLRKTPWLISSEGWGECVQMAAQEVMAKARVLPMRYGKPKLPRLSEAAQFFSITSPRFHRALDDARATGKIHHAIENKRELAILDNENANMMSEGTNG